MECWQGEEANPLEQLISLSKEVSAGLLSLKPEHVQTVVRENPKSEFQIIDSLTDLY